jgi:cytidyltransferase-like protein
VKKVVVIGGWDDLRSRQIRFLHEASKLGELHVLMWSDATIRSFTGADPKFPESERRYLLDAIRYVGQVAVPTGAVNADSIPGVEEVRPDIWVVSEVEHRDAKRAFSDAHGVECRVIREDELRGFPVASPEPGRDPSPRKKVIVTGCYDWLHSGHVRFFETVSQLGDLYVVVGHDENVRMLKGEKHPLFPQEERRYLVQSVRHVHQAVISSGHGWLDAEPEMATIGPDIYAVNEDGDVPEKRNFCEQHGIQYVVLKRTPKEGLPHRESTSLRGF